MIQILFVILIFFPGFSYSLINLKFTPVDLVKSASNIWHVEVIDVLNDGKVKFKIKETLKGREPEKGIFVVDGGYEESVLKKGESALIFTGDFSKASTAEGKEKPEAMIIVGIKWFAMFKKDKEGDNWYIDSDPFDLNSVWAGSARMLVDCVKYCLKVPEPEVPASPFRKFSEGKKIGRISGKATGIKVIDIDKIIITSDCGDRMFEFPSGRETMLSTTNTVRILEVINDYDGDGILDKVIISKRPRLLKSQQIDITDETGELDYHTKSKPEIISVVDCDFNQDSRPDLLLVYKGKAPEMFFNRGFGCFGIARDLIIEESEIEISQYLKDGVQIAEFVDINEDGILDLLAVDMNGDIWGITIIAEHPPGPAMVIRSMNPVTVIARVGMYELGARLIYQDSPAILWLKNPGAVDLEWDGGKKRVVVIKKTVFTLDKL